MNDTFKNDVDLGLSSNPKHLSSKYFYDKKGDALFIKIMDMPEYYLTRAEFEIFEQQTLEIIRALQLTNNTFFELIELGAGDGTKTKKLLKALDNGGFKFHYIPIDISQNSLNNLQKDINEEFPSVAIKTQQGDYFDVLASLKNNSNPKVILFLGSNIGNLNDANAKKFLKKMDHVLDKGDKVLLGLDLIKSKEIVLPAYNDSQGITKEFNLNLLDRINKELDANFNREAFEHFPEYTEEEGIARSFLISTKDQEITIGALKKSFKFKKGERIHTETSRKYNDKLLTTLLENTSLHLVTKLTDSKHYFADYILTKK